MLYEHSSDPEFRLRPSDQRHRVVGCQRQVGTARGPGNTAQSSIPHSAIPRRPFVLVEEGAPMTGAFKLPRALRAIVLTTLCFVLFMGSAVQAQPKVSGQYDFQV